MQVLMTILYILLFLVFLSILIIIHELGHLAAAKAFKVYCLEYSIGMGPAIFKYKGKNAETQFSLRAIPFGGYVSMYGEGVELPEGVEIPESRSINGIKAWKRAIILLAGVTMNAFLALVFFFISNCFPKDYMDYVNHINVAESSIAAAAGLDDDSYVKFVDFDFYDDVAETKYLYYLIDNTTTFNGDDSIHYATCIYFEKQPTPKDLDLANRLCFYELKNDPISLYSKLPVTDFTGKTIFIGKDYNSVEWAYELLLKEGIISSYSLEKFDPKDLDYVAVYSDFAIECVDSTQELCEKVDKDEIAILSDSEANEKWESSYKVFSKDNHIPNFKKYVAPTFETASIHFTKRVTGPKGGRIDGDIVSLNITQTEGKVNPFGLSVYYLQIKYTFPEIIQHTFSDFGRSSVLLFQAIGDLFTKPSTWQNIGGIVAVGFETTSVLQNYGFGMFLFYWGFISVNLAIFNLLPFPGLDGWQLLVLIVESTTRKKIPEKVKNIVSLVGIGLLLLLMGVVVVKDVIKYIFMGMALL
jgi:membrane-associated protease RseP (regulator of RpoE activity)